MISKSVKIFLALLFLFTTACKMPFGASDVKIAGGVEVGPGDLPYGNTMMIFSETGTCSATLVGPNHAITTAHCGNVIAQASAQAVLANKPVVLSQKYFIAHPKWNKQNALNDIAILVFDAKLPSEVRYAQIGREQDLRQGGKIEVAGWGLTSMEDSKDLPAKLRKVDMNVGKVFSGVGQIGLQPDPGKGLCKGDSGGPGFMNGKLVGVNSYFFDPCGNESYLTNLPQFLGFVRAAFSAAGVPLAQLNDVRECFDCVPPGGDQPIPPAQRGGQGNFQYSNADKNPFDSPPALPTDPQGQQGTEQLPAAQQQQPSNQGTFGSGDQNTGNQQSQQQQPQTGGDRNPGIQGYNQSGSNANNFYNPYDPAQYNPANQGKDLFTQVMNWWKGEVGANLNDLLRGQKMGTTQRPNFADVFQNWMQGWSFGQGRLPASNGGGSTFPTQGSQTGRNCQTIFENGQQQVRCSN